ncbi:DNA glycosylase [Cutaneotrichosporon oleaginosum]|uniref:Adenine DNA glycosylase n=1 Tax=Cutaneotrichosporon oleaginosum TaxID=879819 RepID=A0A0J0XF07_9TREE|nr:DNA glycosylase [Cutaneotrichosporon oleaginosum]KLT39646.1 DNA glycosylase [Cutaneotrichosporon oleaginosum]TXT07047.1 hypothetical protein COLE_06378 [Cutaneotrichosporon oleaginosum]
MPPRRAAATAAARAFRDPPRSPSLSPSIHSVSNESDFAPNEAGSSSGPPSLASRASSPSASEAETRGKKRKRAAPRPISRGAIDIEDCVPRHHGPEYHAVDNVAREQQKLLDWFEGVRDARGMPWRKRYDSSATSEEKGQRAYEIWVSEIMLQQTQVATVIDYWNRWMAKWPTIADLAEADLEEVNAVWRGLGYYRRAKSLLEGAKVVMNDMTCNHGLPSDPDTLERIMPGVGRYTAGAISSMAFGIRAPIVDGNVHRVFTRLLGVHAPQAAPGTTRFLWDVAEALVDKLPRGLSRGIAGDWNQALMELGATVCRPAPVCDQCPLRAACKAYEEAELLKVPPPPRDIECTLCEPVPGKMAVTVFPMKKAKKESRVEHEAVVLTEWIGVDDRRWLFLKRPEQGLLAGLFEPPTIQVTGTGAVDQLLAGRTFVTDLLGDIEDALEEHTAIAPVPHIFSHINMTYHVQRIVLRGDRPNPKRGEWLSLEQVRDANVGTGVKKCWAKVYGAWGSGEVGQRKDLVKKQATKAPLKRVKRADGQIPGKKRVVTMPTVPKRRPKTRQPSNVEVEENVEIIVVDG